MSRLIYGGIEIAYIHTLSVERTPEYSDDGTEYKWTRITINVQGVISNPLVPATGGETPAQTLKRVEHTLEIPRQQLTYYAGDGVNVYVSSPPAGATTDAQNGPYPRKLTIAEVSGTQCFTVNYTIETYLVECPTSGAPLYASWRYRVTDQKDENLYTRLTTSGKIICRADLNVNPDSLRGIYSPGIPPGFRRLSASYTLQEDGLAVMYEFVDQEVFLEPPNPSTHATGEYIESTNNGALRFGEVRVRLEGPKVSLKSDLVGLAILIAQNKLTDVGVDTDRVPVVGAIREDLWENNIEVRFRAMISKSLSRKAGANIDLSRFGSPIPGSLPGQAPFDPGTRGTAGIQMLAGVLNDPCLQQNVLTTCLPGTTTPVGLEPVQEATVILTTVLPDDQSALVTLSTTANPGVYTDYKVNCRYERVTGNHALGVAMSAPVNGDTVFVKLHALRKVLVADWEAEKWGSKPTMPDDLDVADSNAVLLKSHVTPLETDLGADGVSVVFKVRGQDVYGFKDQSKVDYEHPLVPWMAPQVAQVVTLQATDFAQGIFRPAGGVQGVLQGGGVVGGGGGGGGQGP